MATYDEIVREQKHIERGWRVARRPWSVGKRYGLSMTEVVTAGGDLVCVVPTHERAHNDAGKPVGDYVMTGDGLARLAAIIEAGA